MATTETTPLQVMPKGKGPASQMMTETPSILVRQDVDMIEVMTACDKRNKYKIASLGNVDDPDFTGRWTDTKFKDAPRLATGKEESDFCCRLLLKNMREFTLHIKDKETDEEAYTLHRPFKCTIICCCKMFNPQRIDLNDRNGTHLGKAEQDWRCGEACCGKLYWQTRDAGDQVQHVVRSNTCCNANMCAPSCCCPTWTADIMNEDESEVVGRIENIFPKLECKPKALLRFCCPSDQYKLVFPPNATEEQRALLLANMFLIDFQMFEKADNNS